MRNISKEKEKQRPDLIESNPDDLADNIEVLRKTIEAQSQVLGRESFELVRHLKMLEEAKQKRELDLSADYAEIARTIEYLNDAIDEIKHRIAETAEALKSDRQNRASRRCPRSTRAVGPGAELPLLGYSGFLPESRLVP